MQPNYKLDYRIALGLEYLSWKETDEGKASAKTCLVSFAKQKWQLEVVEKKQKVFVGRCSTLASAIKNDSKVWKTKGRHCAVDSGVKRSMRIRNVGLQGRPAKAHMLRDGVWDWFVSIRSAVAVRIPPKLVIVQAKALATDMIKQMEKTGLWIDIPKIDKNWLQRWKKHYGVSLRKPNRRFKCSKGKLLGRLKAMWVTTVRLRALAKFTLKRDLVCEGYDQKGLHMNEGGSKNTGCLAIKGAPEVPLKENHADTRQRFSLMTGVTSSEEDARRVGGPPLEILFKGLTKFIVKGLDSDSGTSVSLTFAPKGSYRCEHVVAFLRRWLQPWTPEREASADYRLLYLDAFAAHLQDEVVECAWQLGYYCVYHGGCTTGVSQVNDTDLHAALERMYVDMEAISFYHQQKVDPGNIGRSRQQVPHEQASCCVCCVL